MTLGARFAALAGRLAAAGCVAPEEEAGELLAAAAGDGSLLESMVARRLVGEPLAWVTGSLVFAGQPVYVDPGVYVPRHQTELLARRAVELLPGDGVAADLCTGTGAVAVALRRAHPRARVVATDVDRAACACARRNGVEVYEGSMAASLPVEVRGACDVVTAVVPYVPTDQLAFLPRDVLTWEPLLALDGGPTGTALLVEAVWAAAGLLGPGGTLLLEVGGDEGDLLAPTLEEAGFGPALSHVDDDGDVRAVEVVRR